MLRHEYDVVVVGAGSGGYAAARTARDCGAKAALVDHGPLGGLCILRGCMPSKAFLASSDRLHDVRTSAALGVRVDGTISADMPFIQRRKRMLVNDFASYRIEGIETFDLYVGRASFSSPTELRVGDDTALRARNFIVATGSVVAPPIVPGLVEAGYIDSDRVLELEEIPHSVVVMGGGFTACELGQFLARMGAETTQLIRSSHLLTSTDDDIGNALTGYFREEGIRVVTKSKLQRVTVADGKKIVHAEVDGESRAFAVDEIFYALGRVANVAGLNLEAAGVDYSASQGIRVDSTLRTSNRNIFAVGDVMGDYQLVHVAIYQGEIAARNVCSQADEEADYRIVSAETLFTEPQIALVGKSEKDLVRDHIPYVRGKYEFAEHGKAMTLGKTQGFVKMMADLHTGEILGAAIVGPQGSELIHEVIVAMNYHATVEQFMRIPHLHPTLAEIWTYPAEECATQLGARGPKDQMIEVATSGTAG
jgi:pyruvate/2-oxoglutarate dehydrogenase complex dihydrolipoamide dehydrogenase (E3) component